MELQKRHWVIVALIAFNILLFGSIAINTDYFSASNQLVDNNAAIDKAMDKIGRTFFAGDDSYAIDVMYEPIMDSLGGRETMAVAMKVIRQQMKAMNLQMDSWTMQKPYRYVETNERLYAVIPYESTMTLNGRRIHAGGYYLGIKESGRDWEFIGGDKLNAKMYSRFFPDFPRDINLPISTVSPNNSFR